MFVRKSTYDRATESLTEQINVQCVEIWHLKAKLSACEKSSAPVKNKAGRWINLKTGSYVKAPDPLLAEHKKAHAAYAGVRNPRINTCC